MVCWLLEGSFEWDIDCVWSEFIVRILLMVFLIFFLEIEVCVLFKRFLIVCLDWVVLEELKVLVIVKMDVCGVVMLGKKVDFERESKFWEKKLGSVYMVGWNVVVDFDFRWRIWWEGMIRLKKRFFVRF